MALCCWMSRARPTAGYLQSGDYTTALRLGTACGSATAFSLGLAKKEEIEKLLLTI